MFFRIRYCVEADSFDLELSSDGGNHWYLEYRAVCVHRRGALSEEGPDYVSMQLVFRIQRAINAGYVARP